MQVEKTAILTNQLPEVKVVGTEKDGIHTYKVKCIKPHCDQVNVHTTPIAPISFRSDCCCGSSVQCMIVDKLDKPENAPVKESGAMCIDDVCLTCD
jgi:hypothetical protein